MTVSVVDIIFTLLHSRVKEVWITLTHNNKEWQYIFDGVPKRGANGFETYDFNESDIGPDLAFDGFQRAINITNNAITGKYFDKEDQITYNFEITVSNGGDQPIELLSYIINY